MAGQDREGAVGDLARDTRLGCSTCGDDKNQTRKNQPKSRHGAEAAMLSEYPRAQVLCFV
jgi:hypothetical protein